MNRLSWLGLVLLVAGVAGYVAGVVADYPGRAFSVTAVMIGLTLLAVADPPTDGEPT